MSAGPARARDLVRELAGLRGLDLPVARFRWRARRLAQELDDRWALDSATGLEDLAGLLRLARGRTEVVELGTATGWTAISLALADPARGVVTCDPVVHLHRQRYLALVPESVRARIEFVHAAGADAAREDAHVELLFVDSTHEREPTLAEFRAWRPRLAAGAVVVFHDYGHPDFPGVAEAVSELGLDGDVVGGMFVWRAPAG